MQYAGMPVPLKLEVNRARARLGIDRCGTVNVSAAPSGMAIVTFFGGDGATFGPIQVNHRLAPPERIIAQERERLLREKKQLAARRAPIDPNAPYRHIPYNERPRIRGMVPDDYGRLPGDNGYNTTFPPGRYPFSVMDRMNSSMQHHGATGVHGLAGAPGQGNIPGADQYGRLPGDPDYMRPFPPGHPALPCPTPGPDVRERLRRIGLRHPALPCPTPGPQNPVPNVLPPVFPWLDNSRGYMAGLTRSIAEARLAQQLVQRNVAS